VSTIEENADGSDFRPEVLLVCSSGGHLLLLHQLEPWWSKHRRLWVTFRMADSLSLLRGERVSWAFHPTTRNARNLVRNLRLAWRIIRHQRPSLVVSTGAGVAFPFFVVARLHRIRTVYVEALERIESPSLTARLCYPISSLFLLQWPEQQRFFPRGQVIGALY
jgi:UDP-N-acetylglucosamine:LPS N-acetylglucosamine transferase